MMSYKVKTTKRFDKKIKNLDRATQKLILNYILQHLEGTKNPYTTNRAELSTEQRDELIKRAVRQSERYRVLKIAGLNDDEIFDNFNQPREMRVFSYDGDIDTTMTPLDSLLYAKSFLRTGIMSMDPVTGYVKAYVGGVDFTNPKA